MTETHPQTILAGVDGSKHSADALALADVLAAPLEAEVLAAFVHPHGDQRRALGIPLADHRLILVADRSATRGLERTATARNAVMVALGASQRSRLGRIFLGGPAQRLISSAPCPVAIAPSGYADRARPFDLIGCAFDGSPESRLALTWTAALARATDSRVRIITVHEPAVQAVPAFQSIPMITEDRAIEDHLGRMLDEAARELESAGVDVEGRLLKGGAASLLGAESSEVDLMVTGSRGYGPRRAVLLGSVSGAVVRQAECPVVVLPHGAEVADEVAAGLHASSSLA